MEGNFDWRKGYLEWEVGLWRTGLNISLSLSMGFILRIGVPFPVSNFSVVGTVCRNSSPGANIAVTEVILQIFDLWRVRMSRRWKVQWMISIKRYIVSVDKANLGPSLLFDLSIQV